MKLSLLTLGALVSSSLCARNVCQTGIYALLTPLVDYPPAVAYCSAKYPPKNLRFARAVTTSTTAKTSSTTKATTTTKVTQDAKAVQWSSLLSQASNVISTFCSCFERPSTTTTTTKSTTTTSTTTTPTSTTTSTSTSTSTTTTSSTINSQAPGATIVACDLNDSLAGGHGGCTNCACGPDADGVNAYCTGTDGSTKDCNVDSDCPAGEFCDIYAGPGYCLSGLAYGGGYCISTYTPNN